MFKHGSQDDGLIGNSKTFSLGEATLRLDRDEYLGFKGSVHEKWKGVLNAIKKRFCSLLILLLSVNEKIVKDV